MKSILKTLAIVLTLSFTAVSCSSDNDDNDSVNRSRDVKYEVTGNFTGELSTFYIEKGGNALSEDVASLPWTKEFTADAKNAGVSVSAAGTGGIAGQTVTVKMFVGGKVVNELTATTNNNGGVSATLNAYVFPL
jgi:hypothetical protein